LLRKVKSIFDRVAELQRQQLERLEPKLDLSKLRIGKRLDKASKIAEQQENPAALVQAELGIAKVFHSISTPDDNPTDFSTARNMTDVGRKLLQSVGFASPDDASIQLAIEANDAFIDRLQAIHQQAQALTVE
jgi:hypothetical protein